MFFGVFDHWTESGYVFPLNKAFLADPKQGSKIESLCLQHSKGLKASVAPPYPSSLCGSRKYIPYSPHELKVH